jgi:uncharacterized protein
VKPAAGFHIMSKPIGPICNLDCKYCFCLEKENLFPDTRRWAMPAEVLERYIEQYIAAHPGGDCALRGRAESLRC